MQNAQYELEKVSQRSWRNGICTIPTLLEGEVACEASGRVNLDGRPSRVVAKTLLYGSVVVIQLDCANNPGFWVKTWVSVRDCRVMAITGCCCLDGKPSKPTAKAAFSPTKKYIEVLLRCVNNPSFWAKVTVDIKKATDAQQRTMPKLEAL
jgi:hypothetical protein